VDASAALVTGGRLVCSGRGIAVGHRGIVQRLSGRAEICDQINPPRR
jgi:hypothetical protein